jgi:hypothetical protein
MRVIVVKESSGGKCEKRGQRSEFRNGNTGRCDRLSETAKKRGQRSEFWNGSSGKCGRLLEKGVNWKSGIWGGG